MATVDKLTLELSADGINSFIKAMEDAENGLKGVREGMEKTAKEHGIFDKKLDKKDKKKQRKEKRNDKQKEKSSKKLNKNIEDGTKSLDKFLKTLLAISGISFGLNGLMNKSEQVAKRGTDLANQAINTNVKTQDIETAQTTAKALGYSENTLDSLMYMFARNQNAYLSQGGSDLDTQKFFGALYGYDQSGKRTEQFNTDPYETIKNLADILQSNNDTQRALIVDRLTEAGFDRNSLNMLSNKDFLNNWQESRKLAIQDQDRTARAQKNQADLTYSKTLLDNKFTEISEPFNKFLVSFNTLSSTILDELNPTIKDFADQLNVALNVINGYFKYKPKELSDGEFEKNLQEFKSKGNLEKFLKTTASAMYIANDDNGKLKNPSWYNQGEIDLSKSLSGLEDKMNELPAIQDKFIKEYDKLIDNIDKENGVINFKNGDKYGGSWWERFLSGSHYPAYLTDHFDDLIEEYRNNPVSNQELMQSTTSSLSNSTSQVINIDNLNVNTNENNAQSIVQNSVKDAGIVKMSGSSAMSFMYNYG